MARRKRTVLLIAKSEYINCSMVFTPYQAMVFARKLKRWWKAFYTFDERAEGNLEIEFRNLA